MEQWEADLAVHFARTERYSHQAIAKAEAAIAALKAGVDWTNRLHVKAERNRWDYQRRVDNNR